MLTNKTILILSPQSWGTLFLSKHHYAVELAKLGNKVFFLNPPDEPGNVEGITINPVSSYENLHLINHKLSFPYKIKFHAIGLFHLFMKFHVKKILKKIPSTVDIVWSFDLGNLYPLHFFPAKAIKIFHPVDEPLNQTAIDSAKGAQVIFSVTNEILDKYKSYNLPSHFINHGISKEFLNQPQPVKAESKMKVGFSGNLTRNDIDRDVLLQIINENPDKIFHFWGPYSFKQSNIGGAGDDVTKQFTEQLSQQQNVKLHGVVPSSVLANAIQDVDVFLICYDVLKDQSKGTNYHKVMEYISTGKVIVSNNITTYNDKPELVQMVKERNNNKELPLLFKTVTDQLEKYNSKELQRVRKDFAAANTYTKQIERIESVLEQCVA